jgi:hypothetical protein
MLTPAMKSYRLSKLTTAHVSAQGALSSTGQTLATIAAGLGISLDDAEKRLSLLIDEGLAARSTGSRTTARYTSL